MLEESQLRTHATLESERRTAERRPLRVPVILPDGYATMRDISVSGAYFEGDIPHTVGSTITFAFELVSEPRNRIRVRCNGSVVRCDRGASWFGVAARIDDVAFEMYEQTTDH